MLKETLFCTFLNVGNTFCLYVVFDVVEVVENSNCNVYSIIFWPIRKSPVCLYYLLLFYSMKTMEAKCRNEQLILIETLTFSLKYSPIYI